MHALAESTARIAYDQIHFGGTAAGVGFADLSTEIVERAVSDSAAAALNELCQSAENSLMYEFTTDQWLEYASSYVVQSTCGVQSRAKISDKRDEAVEAAGHYADLLCSLARSLWGK